MSDRIKEHSFILDAHLMIVEDNMISDATVNIILEEKINAEWALKKSIQKIRQLFNQIDYEYIRDRIKDVENVAERILRNLSGKEQESLSKINERVIVVAHDLSPARWPLPERNPKRSRICGRNRPSSGFMEPISTNRAR